MELFQFETVPNGVDENASLLYMWEVFDHDGAVAYCYVGKANKGAGRPRKHYRRNINRLLRDAPYRRGAPDNFRTVHRKLADAMRERNRIVLTLLRNVAPSENIFDAECIEQRLRGC